ncbi:Breast cancer anti-estrogen resistance protein 1 [Bulinus truncatus]|nr:Breast cancer anti-estrogen resistance protein 1 [Bulinus truncatus]
MFLAKALYDNIAETPDELAFRRGDVLTVLEQDTKGLDGWWLCSLRGKHGIAPGNRLKILSGMGEPGVTPDANKIQIKGAVTPNNHMWYDGPGGKSGERLGRELKFGYLHLSFFLRPWSEVWVPLG